MQSMPVSSSAGKAGAPVLIRFPDALRTTCRGGLPTQTGPFRATSPTVWVSDDCLNLAGP